MGITAPAAAMVPAHITVFCRSTESLLAGFAAGFAIQTAFLGKLLKSVGSV
jgi:hypothetical protein